LAVESGFPVPDITLFLDLNPDISEQRVSNRGQLDAFESEGEEFMKRVREGYVSLAKSDFSRWITIDASLGNSDAIFKKVIYSLNQRGYFID
jgi:thymidylate kinase